MVRAEEISVVEIHNGKEIAGLAQEEEIGKEEDMPHQWLKDQDMEEDSLRMAADEDNHSLVMEEEQCHSILVGQE